MGISMVLRNRLIRKGKKLMKKGQVPALAKGMFDYIPKATSDCFTVGFAKSEIMPKDLPKKRALPVKFKGKRLHTAKYYIAGYSAWNPAEGALDPMTASAIYMDDNSGRGGVFFVSVDSVGLSSGDVNELRKKMAEFQAFVGARVIHILSTHNHAGIDTIGMWGPVPFTGRNKEYMEIVHNGIISAVKRAYEARRDGDLFYGKKETPPIQRDSRLPHVFCKDLTRLRFVPRDGSREVWMLNYASHTESLLGHNSMASADFAHYMREDITRMAGVDSIYFVGAIGGLIRLKELEKEEIDSILYSDHSDIDAIKEDHIRSTWIGGRALAETAVAIEDERKLEPVINLLRQEYYADADNHVLATILSMGMIRNKPLATGSGGTGLSIRTEMNYCEIGDLRMVLLPCELFPELAYGGYLSAEESAEGKGPELNPRPLIEIADDPNLLVFGLANDFTGYVVPPNDFFLDADSPYINGKKDRLGRGHYEETNSLGPNTAPTIARVFEEIMQTVSSAKR